jgi:hypothetical protein
MFVIANMRFYMVFDNNGYDMDIMQREMEKGINTTTSFIGITTLLVMIFFIVLYVVSIRKVENNLVKSIGIIGIILSVVMICWDFVMLGSPLVVSFDEIGSAWIVYYLTCLAFSIVMLIQFNRNNTDRKVVYKENVLDDLEFE